MRKRALALILASALAAGMLAACGKSPQSEASSAASAPQAPEAGEEVTVTYPLENPDDVTLSWWIPMAPPAAKHITNYSEAEAYAEFSNCTNVNVEFIHPVSGQEKEQLGVLLAGGDLQDLIMIRNWYNGGSSAGVDDGVFMDLTDLVPIYAPDYYKAITSSELAYRLATNSEGRITEFNLIKSSAPAFNRIVWNKSVLEKYGYTDGAAPETVDEYTELFKKMAADGLPGFSPTSNGQVVQFMYPFGITSGFFLGEDGSIRYGQATEEYRDYLTLMNQWYEAGYLYKDFMTNMTQTELQALFNNQQVGMMIGSADQARAQAATVGVDVVKANYPRIKKGDPMHFETTSWEQLPILGGQTTVISADCENPELALEYMNYYYTQEGCDLQSFGIEGKSYVVAEDGTKQYTDYMLNNPDIPIGDVGNILKANACPGLREADINCFPDYLTDPDILAFRMQYSDDPTVDDSQVLPAFQMSMEASTERSKIMRDITTYIDEMTLKFITGAEPLENFDAYLEQLDKMGMQDAIDITASEYEVFLTKPVPEWITE